MKGCLPCSSFRRNKKNKRQSITERKTSDEKTAARSTSDEESIELLTSSHDGAIDERSPRKEEFQFINKSLLTEKDPLLSHEDTLDETGVSEISQLNATQFTILSEGSPEKSTTISNGVCPHDEVDSTPPSDGKVLEKKSFNDFGCQFNQKVQEINNNDITNKGLADGKLTSQDFECQVNIVAPVKVVEKQVSFVEDKVNEESPIQFENRMNINGEGLIEANEKENLNEEVKSKVPVSHIKVQIKENDPETSESEKTESKPTSEVSLSSSESDSPPLVSPIDRKKSALMSLVKRVSPSAKTKFRHEDIVSEEGELLNAAAVRKLLKSPTVKSYTAFMICLKKGSSKFIEQILQECDALQLMFDALAALSLKHIGSFSDTILQLEIVRAVKMILNSPIGIVYLIEEDRGFVSDLAFGKFRVFS